jgi:UrcA family protein
MQSLAARGRSIASAHPQIIAKSSADSQAFIIPHKPCREQPVRLDRTEEDRMFSILLLGLAAAAGSEPIIVVDERPTISIDTAHYDLRQRADMRRLESIIHDAANRVCVRGYGAAIYLERVACVKSAIASGDQQLRRFANNPSAGPLITATISISSK